MIRRTKRFMAAAVAAVLLASAVPVTSFAAMDTSEFASGYTYSTTMRGLTAFQLVSDMGAGWNLGNSLESSDSETNWGNPRTTKAMIDAVAAEGFTTLRVPVRWDDHYSNASSYTIDSTFMDRVETVVNYGLANDMYVILNVHHNDLQHNVPNTSAISAELSAVWTQIGNRFRNYGDKLIFEVNNEPRCGEDWTGQASYFQSVNECNEAARAAIRATGGNNTTRLVMLPTYCASGDEAKAAGWTKNASDDMIAASVHAYLPFGFAFSADDNGGHSDWRDSDVTELKAFFDRLDTYFISKGVPVVLGEFGATNKNNLEARTQWAKVYTDFARRFPEQDIPCVIWDNNCYNVGAENFGLFKRNEGRFEFQSLVDAVTDGFTGNPGYEEQSLSEVVLASGGSTTTGQWGQSVCFSGSLIQDMTSTDIIYAEYTCDKSPYLILQDNDIGSWISVAPDSVSNGVAAWGYNSIVSAYNGVGEFGGIDNVFIGDAGAVLTVSKVTLKSSNAHVHDYTGAAEITLMPTSTTCGKTTVQCSVDGCEEIRIFRTDPISSEEDKKVVEITAANFPDDVFRAYISENFDNNRDNYLSEIEIENVYEIQVGNLEQYGNITSLEGIKYFTSMRNLACQKNKLTSLDLSGMTSLEMLWCYDNQLTELDISGCTSLFSVSCYSNQLESLDTSTVVKLENLYCSVNKLKSLDVTKNIALKVLECGGNHLACLDVSKNTVLETLSCSYNNIALTDPSLDSLTQYGFDPSKVTEWKGAAYDSATNSLTNIEGATVYYQYDAGNGHIIEFCMEVIDPGSVYINAAAEDGKVTVKWYDWGSAEKYRVRRNDGSGWTTLANITDNTYVDTDVVNGTTYNYCVYVYVNGGWYGPTQTVTATPREIKLVPPANVKATAADSVIYLSWDEVYGATAYRVRRSDGKAWTTLGNVTTTAYKDTAVTNGTKYTYGIFAQVNGQWSAASELVTATPAAPYECVPPTGVKATAGDSVVNITWNAVDGATAYRVRRNDGTAWATLGNVTTTSYKDTAVTNGTKYTYGIFAQVNGQWSAASALVAATPVAAYECVPPTGVKATAGDSVITVAWNAVEGATAYRVRRNDGTAWATLANVTATSYKDSAVTNGKKYTYGIFAQVNGTWSAASALVAATPEAIECIPPASVTIKSESGKVSLEWSAVNGATKYRVRRSDGNGWTNLASVSATSYVDSSVTNGTNYVYGIFAYVEGAWSAASALVQAKPAAVVSGVANGLTITTTADSITLSWDVVDGAEKYRVRRSDGVAWATKQTSAKTTFVDTDVVAGTTYKYSIYCYSDGAFGAPSSTVAAIL